jgi:hypothetical protein
MMEHGCPPVELQVLNLEVDANGGDEGRGKGVIGVPEQQARLADTCSGHRRATLEQ